MAGWKARNTCEGGMLSLYRTLSLRYLRQRWSRAALVIASIALGVATLVSTQALNQTMTKAARAAVNPLAGAFDLQVCNGDLGVERELADALAASRIPGVVSATPLVLDRVALPDLHNRSAVLLGVDVQAGPA